VTDPPVALNTLNCQCHTFGPREGTKTSPDAEIAIAPVLECSRSPPTSSVPAGHAAPVAVAPLVAGTGTTAPANLVTAAEFADAGPKNPMTSMITCVESVPKFCDVDAVCAPLAAGDRHAIRDSAIHTRLPVDHADGGFRTPRATPSNRHACGKHRRP
jgi:hypothetical protein